MAYSWPSWVSISLGAVLLAIGVALGYSHPEHALVGPMAVAGAVLLGLGLHALQASYDAWCADCWDDCGCDHCGDCAEGDCCGACACAEPATPNGHSH
ncbi:MAG: hypothetical protein QOD77_143 [Thermoplasmata archaeon]|jgi:hypothetical protein|nr:hypothetical protein [Thermoplasmata archaeon]